MADGVFAAVAPGLAGLAQNLRAMAQADSGFQGRCRPQQQGQAQHQTLAQGQMISVLALAKLVDGFAALPGRQGQGFHQGFGIMNVRFPDPAIGLGNVTQKEEQWLATPARQVRALQQGAGLMSATGQFLQQFLERRLHSRRQGGWIALAHDLRALSRSYWSRLCNRSGVPTSTQWPLWCRPMTRLRIMALRSTGPSLPAASSSSSNRRRCSRLMPEKVSLSGPSRLRKPSPCR